MTNGQEPEDNEFLDEDGLREDIIAGEEDFDIDLKGDPLVITREICENLKQTLNQNATIIRKYLGILVDITKSHPNNYEVFYTMVEGISEIANLYQEGDDAENITIIIDQLISLFEKHKGNLDYLASLSDAILDTLVILISNELYDQLEEYVIYLVNKSIDNPDDLMLRTTAAEATILAIRGFGEDWNYEKTKEFDIILKGLLPPKEIDGFLAGILIKGLSEEIDCYGDMHEFSSLKRTLKLMRELYLEKTKLDNESILNYLDGLVKAINWFGEAEEYEEMIEILDELTDLSEEFSQNIEAKIHFANGLRIALDHCGVMEDLDNATKLAKKLLALADEMPNNKRIQSLAIMGVFKAAIWAGVFWEVGLINALLTSVEKVYQRFPEDIQIKILLGRGLFNITKEFSLINKEKLMTKILDELSSLYQKNPDIIDIVRFYSQALVNIIYMVSEFNENFDGVLNYLSESKQLTIKYPEDDMVILSYSKALVNVIRAFGLYGKIGEMDEKLDVLRDFTESTESLEVLIRLGKAYVDVIKIYGDINELELINPMVMEIKDWIDDDPTNIDFHILLAKALVNTISSYGKNSKINEMLLQLDELRDIAIHFPSYGFINVQLARGLTHSIRWYAQDLDLTRSLSLLHELRSISIDFHEENDIQEMLARSTRRIITMAYKLDKFELVEEQLDSLRKHLKQYSLNENIQVELARALTNVILEETSIEENSYWQSLIMELKGLRIQYPENDKLAAIHQTVSPLIKD
ncbi:MAG: hypothetical protein HZR80_07300 [Candidatus Heimdallarchaeota archaeon]